MLKRFFSILLALSLCVLTLAGCQSSAPATAAPSSSAPAASSTPAAPSTPVPSTDFPQSPIKIIVVRAAGGSADVVARMYAPFLQKHIGVNVVVENIDGGTGKIGLSQAFRSNPDGYTLVLANLPSYVLTQHIEGGVDYVMSEFEPIVGVSGNEGNVLMVPGNSPFNTVDELLAYDKANPDTLNIAVTSGLSNSSLAQAMFVSRTEFSARSIPYDSGNASVTAVMGGHVDVAVSSAVAAYQPAADGVVKVLCTFGMNEDKNLPNVPTFASLYGEDYAYDVVMGILAPPGTPPEILEILRTAGLEAAKDPEFASTVGDSFNVVAGDSEEFRAAIAGCYDLADASRDLLTAMVS